MQAVLSNVWDLIIGLVSSGFLTSKKTVTSAMGIVSLGIASIVGVNLSTNTQTATVAWVTIVLASLAIQDYVLGKIKWSQLDDDLAKLFLKREVVAGLVGVIVLWVYDLTGYEVGGDVVNAILVIYSALMAGQSVQTIGKVQDAATDIREEEMIESNTSGFQPLRE